MQQPPAEGDIVPVLGQNEDLGRWGITQIMRLGFAVALLLCIPSAASATLGGDAASVDADRVQVQGALVGITRRDAYAVHELQAPSGTSVREYVSPTGQVFGVAWQGPWMPDMRQLLGPYFDQYQSLVQAAQASPRRRRGSLVIDTPGLVVHASGHPRAFSGSAYVPALVPQGVGPETVK